MTTLSSLSSLALVCFASLVGCAAPAADSDSESSESAVSAVSGGATFVGNWKLYTEASPDAQAAGNGKAVIEGDIPTLADVGPRVPGRFTPSKTFTPWLKVTLDGAPGATAGGGGTRVVSQNASCRRADHIAGDPTYKKNGVQCHLVGNDQDGSRWDVEFVLDENGNQNHFNARGGWVGWDDTTPPELRNEHAFGVLEFLVRNN